MGNSWFQFKEFRVEQGRSAMKVCTDSCIFGAYVAMRESENPSTCKRFLDVGSGTGLLSLMVAQKLPQVKIEAVEKDDDSFLDCRLNFESSPWSSNLNVTRTSIEEYASDDVGYFDRLICNPPFFLNHLLSPDQKRNQSMHNTEYFFQNWLQLLSGICLPHGKIWLLLDPVTWEKSIPLLGSRGLFACEILILVQTKGRIWRNLVCLTKEKTDLPETKFQKVYESIGCLDPVIKHWLHDYYL
jgi:tRNA1Val (adenine37-N6)-methyltransferase